MIKRSRSSKKIKIYCRWKNEEPENNSKYIELRGNIIDNNYQEGDYIIDIQSIMINGSVIEGVRGDYP